MATKKATGGPAFPESCNGQIIPGLTKREWYAAQALIALHSSSVRSDDWNELASPKEAARIAFQMADAMIAEGEK